jgi:hypothetical protein
MKDKIIIFGIFISLLLTMGCTLQSPEDNPTYSVLPEMLLDYDQDNQETKIWVKSAISDFKYNKIIIELTSNGINKITQDNNTYCISTSTKSNNFNISISVISENNEFQYQASIRIQFEEEILTITIFEPIEDLEEIILEDDLPFKRVLEEVE